MSKESLVSQIQTLEKQLAASREMTQSWLDRADEITEALTEFLHTQNEIAYNIKFDSDQQIAAVRQEMAKTNKEYARELNSLRRAWLHLPEEIKPEEVANHANHCDDAADNDGHAIETP